MTSFIRVTTKGSPFLAGAPMLINIEAVTRLRPAGDGAAIVVGQPGFEIEVRESFETLAMRLHHITLGKNASDDPHRHP